MKKEYSFAKGEWQENEFFYAYSPACMDRVKFRQEKDAIVNGKGNSFCGYEMIPLLEKTKHRIGVVVETECSFENFGAPLLVITDDVSQNEKGESVYGRYFEIVAYEQGINVWSVIPAEKGENCPISATLLATKKFSIEANTRINIKVEVCENAVKAWVNGEYLETAIEALPSTFYVGVTACEGINRFYSFAVQD